jgi:exonuclease SbcD
MLKILHFSDAHIDMANYGRHDPLTGLPLRVMDFLKSLDTIVDTAIAEKVDLVLFAGDAYKDRSPQPTFQREWERRTMRLSDAGIPTLLLVGNHDLSPALGRAHAMEEFKTLNVPHVRVLDRPMFLGPQDLEGLPLQVIALPWLSRSGLMAHLELSASEPAKIFEELEKRLQEMLNEFLSFADPGLPVILTAHASVQGAQYDSERQVMLGEDLVLSGSLVKNPALDYVALGHIHKAQNLNEDSHPPVIYPGSIERVDFGEASSEKFFVIASIERGRTLVEWRKLEGIRPFIGRFVRLEIQDDAETARQKMLDALSPDRILKEAVVRLVVEYPRGSEELIDESALRKHAAEAFEFYLIKRPWQDIRIRLPGDASLGSLSPLELLEKYWESLHLPPEEIQSLDPLAAAIIAEVSGGLEPEP